MSHVFNIQWYRIYITNPKRKKETVVWTYRTNANLITIRERYKLWISVSDVKVLQLSNTFHLR